MLLRLLVLDINSSLVVFIIVFRCLCLYLLDGLHKLIELLSLAHDIISHYFLLHVVKHIPNVSIYPVDYEPHGIFLIRRHLLLIYLSLNRPVPLALSLRHGSILKQQCVSVLGHSNGVALLSLVLIRHHLRVYPLEFLPHVFGLLSALRREIVLVFLPSVLRQRGVYPL